MTYLEIQQGCFQRLNKSPAPDPVTASRIQTFINDRYRQLLREGGIEVRDETLTIVTEANRARYALPTVITEIYNVFDSTNRIPLKPISLAEIRRRDPSVPGQIVGTSWRYAILNEAGIGQQPTVITPNALEIVSTSPADTQVATIEYRGANGFQIVTATLNGTNTVPVVATVRELFRLSLSALPVGTILVREIVSGAILTAIAGSLTSTLHAWVMHFWPTPAGPYSMVIDFARPRRPLVNPGDEPAIPEEFHTLLVYGACMEEAVKMDDSRARTYEQQYREGVLRFRAFLHQSRGARWIPKDRQRAWNDLGSWYPGYSDGGW